MRLAQYLRKHNLTQAEFARRVEAPRSAVHKWLNGERPSDKYMPAIYRETNGEVTPNDFYTLRKRARTQAGPPGELSAAEIFDRELGEPEVAIYVEPDDPHSPPIDEERRLKAIHFLQEVIRDLSRGGGKADV